jgi:hypothetical protein
MSEEEAVRWTDRPLRRCYSLHSCVLCHHDIRYGEEYYDGGFGRRAHFQCVNEALYECTRGEA